MSKMNRIQRRRTKGFKLPENTKCVNRGTKWGNPVKLVGDMIFIDAGYRGHFPKWVYLCDGDIENVIILYKMLITDNFTFLSVNPDVQHWLYHFRELDVKELSGKNLACFCPLLDENNKPVPCHADVLLELANE